MAVECAKPYGVEEEEILPEFLIISGITEEPGMNEKYELCETKFNGRAQWMAPGTRRYARWYSRPLYAGNPWEEPIAPRWEIYVSHLPRGTTFFRSRGDDTAVPPVEGWMPALCSSQTDHVQVNRPMPEPAAPMLTGIAAEIARKAREKADAYARNQAHAQAKAKQIVDEAVANNKVVMFSKSYCRYCEKAKTAFDDYGYKNYTVIELEEGTLEWIGEWPAGKPAGMPDLTYVHPQRDLIQDYLKTKTGFRTVPQVFVDGICIGGCEETVEQFGDGTLPKLLV